MALKQGLSQDIINCFLNTDEFAEDIVYTPKGESAKSIRAIVNRKRLDPSSEDSGRVLAGQAEIFVANDTAHGISLVSKGQDKCFLFLLRVKELPHTEFHGGLNAGDG